MRKLLFKALEMTGPLWGGFINYVIFPFLKKLQEKQKLKKIADIKRQDERSVEAIENVLASKPKSKVEKRKRDKELEKQADNILGG